MSALSQDDAKNLKLQRFKKTCLDEAVLTKCESWQPQSAPRNQLPTLDAGRKIRPFRVIVPHHPTFASIPYELQILMPAWQDCLYRVLGRRIDVPVAWINHGTSLAQAARRHRL